ncbi:MAG: hypothetical protein MJZ38_07430 [archaeon]|nr:hypothetical protein [archaeon]
MSDAKRPLLITLIGGLEALAGLAFIIFGVLSLMGMSIEIPELSDLAGAVGIVAIILGIIPFIIGYGMLKGWKIMWYLGVIFGILSIIVGVLDLNIISIVIQLIILYYLFRPKVRAFFRD